MRIWSGLDVWVNINYYTALGRVAGPRPGAPSTLILPCAQRACAIPAPSQNLAKYPFSNRLMALYSKPNNAPQTYVSQMPLDVGYLRSFYERSGHRLLLLDYDGTLMPHIPLAQLAQVSGAQQLNKPNAPRINVNINVLLGAFRQGSSFGIFSRSPSLSVRAQPLVLPLSLARRRTCIPTLRARALMHTKFHLHLHLHLHFHLASYSLLRPWWMLWTPFAAIRATRSMSSPVAKRRT